MRRAIGARYGVSLTALRAALVAVAIAPLPPVVPDVVFTMTPSTTYQTILGMLGEIQFDSIDGDGAGIQEANTRGFPHGLSSSEQARAGAFAMSYEGNPYVYHRFALGLYCRGFDPTGRFINRERAPGANAALKAMLDTYGGKLACGWWSIPPYYKINTPVQGGPTYDGSTITPPDRLTDPAGWNAYLRNLLQGGRPNHPDKVASPAAYSAWMTAFAADMVKTLEYVHQNCGCVGAVFIQNEPTHYAAYPSCEWPSGEALYDALKAVDAAIANSTILATYNGQPNAIRYWHDEMQGQQGRGTGFIKADPAIMTKMIGWAAHDIEPIATDGNVIYASRNSFNNFLSGTGAAAGITLRRMWTENEQFDPYVTPGNVKYKTPEWYFANIILSAFNAFVYTNSALHSPIIHVAKDTDTAYYEQLGRATIRWRPAGSPAPSDLPALAPQSWAPNPYAYNSTMAMIRHIKNGSKRIEMSPLVRDAAVGHLAFQRPDGRIVAALVNRGDTPKLVQIDLGGDTFDGFGYSVASFGSDLGARSGVVTLSLAPYTAQFWVGRSGTPIDVTPPVILTSATHTVAENSSFSVALTSNEPVTWAIVGGADAARFTLTGATLSMPGKDFEVPIDADANNVYVVGISATDLAGNVSSQTLSVTVTDVNEAGPAPVIFQDSFTRANGDITANSADWTLLPGGSGALPQIKSNYLINTNTGALGQIVLSRDLGALDQEVSFTPKGVNGGFHILSVTDYNNFLGIRVSTTQVVEVFKKVGGTFTSIGTVSGLTNLYSKRVTLRYHGSDSGAAKRFEVLIDGAPQTVLAGGSPVSTVTGVPSTSRAGINNRSVAADPMADDYENKVL